MTFSRKIGGEMPWADGLKSETANVLNACSSKKPHNLWVNSGRSALAVALRILQKAKACHRIWLPAFICPSVPETCTIEGYAIRNYAVDDRLQIVTPSIEETQSGDVFLVVHYFGFPSDASIPRLKEKGLWVIEDAVQAAFTDTIAQQGHFIFNSLRKFTPLPDGAWLGSDFPIEETLEEPDHDFLTPRMEGKRLKARHAPDAEYLRLFAQSEARLDRDKARRKMSDISQAMQSTLDLSVIAESRRKNFSRLLELLSAFPGIRPIYQTLPFGTVPLGLPVTLENISRDQLRKSLQANGIFCPIHWLLSDGLPKSENKEAWNLSEKILTFPIDQRYTEDDMEFIATVLKKSGMVS